MIKSKPCTVEGCGKPRFAKGYCKAHQSLRTDKKPKPIKKISEKGKVKKEMKKALVQNDMSFYLDIWLEREHRCFETGRLLGPKPLITYFHHVLPKQTYPEYRHSKWNIVILHPDTHNQVETNIDLCPKVKALTEKLKQEVLDGKHAKASLTPVFEDEISEL